MKKRSTARVRFIVMLAFLAVVAAGYFVTGGIGNVCGVGFDTITLLCPLGAILTMLAQHTTIPLALISVVVTIVICVLLGRAFCSWVCPVHFMTARRRRARGRKAVGAGAQAESTGLAEAPSVAAGCSSCAACANPCGKREGVKLDSRHAILAAAIISTLIFGFPVFCLVCPVGLTFALVLLVLRLFTFGEATWTIILFAAVVATEVVLLPRWCQSLCPLGAVHSLFSGLNRTFRPTIDEHRCLEDTKGVTCGRCVTACPEGINLHDVALGETTLADCTKCKACADACPTGAIAFPFLPPRTEAAVTPETTLEVR